MASPPFHFVRIEGHRLVELDKGFLGREKSPYRAGFRWCRECVAFVQTDRVWCVCGTQLRVHPDMPADPYESGLSKFRAMFAEAERPSGQLSILNY